MQRAHKPPHLLEFPTSEGDHDVTYIIVEPEYHRAQPETRIDPPEPAWVEWGKVYLKGDPLETELLPYWPERGDPLWPLYERIEAYVQQYFEE